MGSVDKQWTKQTVKCLTPLGEVSLSSFLGGGRLQLYEETMIHHKNLMCVIWSKFEVNLSKLKSIFRLVFISNLNTPRFKIEFCSNRIPSQN